MNYKWLFSTPIAHRGYHDGKTIIENTRPAFQAAIDKKLNIEIDVHISKDGEVVVFHDSTLKRVCGVDRKVYEMTLAELKQARVIGTDDDILTLKELLELVNEQVGLLIEVKYIFRQKPYRKIASAIYELLKNYKGDYAIQSFFPNILKWYRDNVPEIATGLLASNYNELNLPRMLKGLMIRYNRIVGPRYVRRLKPVFVSYNIGGFPSPHISVIRKKGAKVLCWTVINVDQIPLALECADNIIFETEEVLNLYLEKR